MNKLFCPIAVKDIITRRNGFPTKHTHTHTNTHVFSLIFSICTLLIAMGLEMDGSLGFGEFSTEKPICMASQYWYLEGA